ncbi:MAG TPA: STAS domain-containing protein [Terriglobia bacterium]|nr:STAS domain-containing protein [Terriglobia bacterium]
MALQITEQEWGTVTVLTLAGRATLGEETSQLRNRIKAVLGQGKKRVVLDLGNLAHIDSAGLGTLVSGYYSATSQGASIKLANLTKRLEEQLHLTKLVTVFETHSSVEEAVMAFRLEEEPPLERRR